MASYYVNRNAQSDGYHEVHRDGCSYLPDANNRLYLGQFYTCGPAVIEAKKYYNKVDGCYWCSRACHTR